MTPMNNHIENRLWAAADQLWANWKSQTLRIFGAGPRPHLSQICGLQIWEGCIQKYLRNILPRPVGLHQRSDFQERIGLFIPNTARFSYLQKLPEGEDIGKAINEAMKAIEAENEDLKDVLPKNYQKIDNPTLFDSSASSLQFRMISKVTHSEKSTNISSVNLQ